MKVDLVAHQVLSLMCGGVYFGLTKDWAGAILVWLIGWAVDFDHTAKLSQLVGFVKSGKRPIKLETVQCNRFLHSPTFAYSVLLVALVLFFGYEVKIFAICGFASYFFHIIVDSITCETVKFQNNKLPAWIRLNLYTVSFWRKIILVGNDWMLHVVWGALLMKVFGWWGLLFQWPVHFLLVDTIPHGHLYPVAKDAMKGISTALFLFFYFWYTQGFIMAFMVGVGMFMAIAPDLILWRAHKWDIAQKWNELKNKKTSKVVFNFCRLTILMNHFFHWFTKENSKLSYIQQRDSPEVYHCLNGKIFYPLRVTLHNLFQLGLALFGLSVLLVPGFDIVSQLLSMMFISLVIFMASHI